MGVTQPRAAIVPPGGNGRRAGNLGHEHFYQRIKPQNGISYFVSGAAGSLRAGDICPSNLTAVGFDTDRSFMLIEVAGKGL
jgi:hypothetical protein